MTTKKTTPKQKSKKETLITKKAVTDQTHCTTEVELHDNERGQFRKLILANPNYFGNLKISPFEPVLNIQVNTTYEEIGCVGFQPQFNRLDAVIYINQPSGYGGNICSNGTPEYVRFYTSYDHGATWHDEGVSSFKAYNIPEGTQGQKRLEYAVTLLIQPPKKRCKTENIALVRAILSWNVLPPPNEPDFIPVWGDIHNTHIQIEPRKLIILNEVLKNANSNILDDFHLKPDQLVDTLEPKPLGIHNLIDLYKNKNVEPHRFALLEVQKMISNPALTESIMAGGFNGVLPELDISEIIDNISVADGNTRYEEMECVGLNSEQDTLSAVIRVKLPNGYSGDPCSAGSTEYVTFWADFNNNGTFETCLGTTSVKAYDIDSIPNEGLEYSVFLPVDFSKYHRPCEQGARLVKIRAILSWQVAPPCFNPNFIPIWGNRDETLVHIRPRPILQPGTHPPIIETIGSMGVPDINALNGLANGPAQLAGFTALDSPFGGKVIITGHIGNATDISNGASPLKYRVLVSEDNGITWQALNNNFNIQRTQLLNGIWSFLPSLTQSVDASNFYTYREDLTGGPGNAQIFVAGNVMAKWNTAGLTGLWKIKVEVKDIFNNIYIGSVETVRLDNDHPLVAIDITSGGGACADFTIGDLISGTYSVSDEHFKSLRLAVEPSLGGSFTVPSPLPAGSTMPLVRTYATGVPTIGESGTWTLDTSDMPQCGYVIRLKGVDRTIRNSGFIGFQGNDVKGLCLREPEA